MPIPTAAAMPASRKRDGWYIVDMLLSPPRILACQQPPQIPRVIEHGATKLETLWAWGIGYHYTLTGRGAECHIFELWWPAGWRWDGIDNTEMQIPNISGRSISPPTRVHHTMPGTLYATFRRYPSYLTHAVEVWCLMARRASMRWLDHMLQ